MQTGRGQAAKQILSDPPRRVVVACEALEAEGFRIANNLDTFGRYVLIECQLPLALRDVMTPDNRHYQQIIEYQGDRARQCLKRVRVDADVLPFGWRLVVWLATSNRPVRKGRRREDEKASEILELKSRGYSWTKITRLINQRFGERLSKEGIRSLARSRRRQ